MQAQKSSSHRVPPQGAIVIECTFSKDGYETVKIMKSLHEIKADLLTSGNSIFSGGNNLIQSGLVIKMTKK